MKSLKIVEVSCSMTELRSSRIEGEAESPATWSHPDSSESVTKGRNNCIIMRDYERGKFQTKLSQTSRLCCTWRHI